MEVCLYNACADDTQRYSFYPQELHTAEYIIKRVFDEIYQLLNSHNLQLNRDKSLVIAFGSARVKGIEENLAIHTDCIRGPSLNLVISLGLFKFKTAVFK